MGKLIIVSNRVPSPGAKAAAGGLTVALSQALKDHNGGVWLGWSGTVSETPTTHECQENRINYRTIDFNQKDYDEFYAGFCNSILWPLCHYRMDLCQFAPEMYEGYKRVNRHFAREVAAVAEPGDIVWAHDYHMLLLGEELRTLDAQQRLGFFLHIPFPVPEVFAALPNHAEILKGLSAYDLVGFQTDTDLQAFLRCLTDVFKIPAISPLSDNVYEVTAFGRTFRAGKFSISIDTNELMLAADRSEIDPETIKLKKSLGDRPLLIGVDRLDYTKGLMERFTAYQSFLAHYPEYKGNVSYIQITPPTRVDVKNYPLIREQLETMIARINGVNSEINWTPISYINRSFTRNELAGFYRAARVGLVTPLRDGMNLVAKEYVVSQNPDDPGVLLLSQFAGAVDELKVGALVSNPYNADETAEQIHRALIMPLDERKKRYEAMVAVLKHEDIFHWTRGFLSCLKEKNAKPGKVAPVENGVTNHVTRRLGKISHYLPSLSELIRNLSLTG